MQIRPVMSAYDPKRTSVTANYRIVIGSFDHLVGAAEKWQRQCQAERLGNLEIDSHLDFCGLLHRQVCWVFALKDVAGIDAGEPVGVGDRRRS